MVRGLCESVPPELTERDRRKFALSEKVARRFLEVDCEGSPSVREFLDWVGKMNEEDEL